MNLLLLRNCLILGNSFWYNFGGAKISRSQDTNLTLTIIWILIIGIKQTVVRNLCLYYNELDRDVYEVKCVADFKFKYKMENRIAFKHLFKMFNLFFFHINNIYIFYI